MKEPSCLLELPGGVGVLPVVGIIVPTLIPETRINLDFHFGLPLGIIWYQPLQPSQATLLRHTAGLNHSTAARQALG